MDGSSTGYRNLGPHTSSDFKTLYSNQFIDLSDGRSVPLGQYWLTWPERRTVKGVVFDPTGDHEEKINLWQGLGVEPDVMGIGTWGYLRRLMLEGIFGNDEVAFDYLLKWCVQTEPPRSRS